MPKINHLRKIRELMLLSSEQTKMILGSLVLTLLQDKRITLEEITTIQEGVQQKMISEAKKKR